MELTLQHPPLWLYYKLYFRTYGIGLHIWIGQIVQTGIHATAPRADLRITTGIASDGQQVLRTDIELHALQPRTYLPFSNRQVVGQLDVLQAQVGAILDKAIGIAQIELTGNVRIFGIRILHTPVVVELPFSS